MNGNSANAQLCDDFDACHTMAQQLAKQLRASEAEAMVVSGFFHPDTPVTSWDLRWQQLASRFGSERGFIHYWVESDGRIIDPAVRQFGYTAPIETELADGRYERTALSYFAART